MTETKTQTAPEQGLPAEPMKPDELKALAESLSSEARALLARLGERYESGLTLPADQAAFDELVENDLATGIHGTLVRLTPTGSALNEYLGPYRPGIDPKTEPKLKPPADPADAQEAIREATIAEHEAEEKAAKEAAKKAA